MSVETMTPEEYHKLLAEAMSEKALQANVRKLATDHGWHTYCWWSSLHSPKGWPDVVLIREGGPHIIGADGGSYSQPCAEMMAIELKCERGKPPTPEQLETHRLLRLAGHKVYVWRPSSLLSGEIEEVLQ